jgi:hypothetical protein
VGALGCSFSHQQAWMKVAALKGCEGGAVIWEDDVAIKVRVMAELAAALRGTPIAARPDFLLLGVHAGQAPTTTGEVMHLGGAHRAAYAPMTPWPFGELCTGSHAYYLSRRAAHLLLRHFLPLEVALDSYMQLVLSASAAGVKPEHVYESGALLPPSLPAGEPPLRLGWLHACGTVTSQSDIEHTPVDGTSEGSLTAVTTRMASEAAALGNARIASARNASQLRIEEQAKAAPSTFSLHMGVVPMVLVFAQSMGFSFDGKAPLSSSPTAAAAAAAAVPPPQHAPPQQPPQATAPIPPPCCAVEAAAAEEPLSD